jgi:hypothetical protein
VSAGFDTLRRVTQNEDPPGRNTLDDLRVVDPDALKGDPFAKQAPFLSSLRASGRAWVAGAIAVGVLFLGWRFSVPVSSEVTRATQSGPVRLQAADPSVLKAQIVEDLRVAGVEAIGYDRLGLSGVDARLPEPIPAPVRATLEKHRIPLPADGIIRVEIAESR